MLVSPTSSRACGGRHYFAVASGFCQPADPSQRSPRLGDGRKDRRRRGRSRRDAGGPADLHGETAFRRHGRSNPPHLLATVVSAVRDRVDLNVDPYAVKVAEIERRLQSVVACTGLDWRSFLRSTLGGELSFHEPLKMGLGRAARSGETDDAIIAFTLALLAKRADPARRAQYNAAWIGRTLKSFRAKDDHTRSRLEAAGASLFRKSIVSGSPIELPASVAASGIPAADVPREIRQLVKAIRAAGRRSVSLEPIALRLGLKRTTFLRRVNLRLPLDPEYMGEGLAVLAELREQLAAAAARVNGAPAESAAVLAADTSPQIDVPNSATHAISTDGGKDGEAAGSGGSAGRHDADSTAGTAGTAGTGGTGGTAGDDDLDAEWERATSRSTPSRTRTRRRRPASPPSPSTTRSWPRSSLGSIHSRSTDRLNRSLMPRRRIRKRPGQVSQCRSSPRSGRCCDPSTSISVTRSCRLIRF